MWVEFLNALSMLAIYPVASYYASDDPVRVKFSHLNVDFTIKTREATFYGFLVQAAVVTLCWLPAVFSFAVDGRCEPLAGYGNALGLVVAVIIICKFLPQLHASLNAQGSHSLSYVTYGVDAAAGAVALAQKVFVTHERLSSWLPPVFLHALEIAVLVINYVNDRKHGGRGFGGEFGGGNVIGEHGAVGIQENPGRTGSNRYERVADTDADDVYAREGSESTYDHRDPWESARSGTGESLERGYGARGSGDGGSSNARGSRRDETSFL